MARPRGITTHSCYLCRQGFLTRELLDSHVCPEMDVSDPHVKQQWIDATIQMHKDWSSSLTPTASSPFVTERLEDLGPWHAGWTSEWPDGLEKESTMELDKYLHEYGEDVGLGVGRLNELIRITHRKGWMERVLIYVIMKDSLSEGYLFPEEKEED